MTSRPILEIGEQLGLREDELISYGRSKAKISLDALARLANHPRGRYVLVTSVNPTPLGEGKTTTAVGLVMGLCRLGQRAVVTLRQPSLGPVFGLLLFSAAAGALGWLVAYYLRLDGVHRLEWVAFLPRNYGGRSPFAT